MAIQNQLLQQIVAKIAILTIPVMLYEEDPSENDYGNFIIDMMAKSFLSGGNMTQHNGNAQQKNSQIKSSKDVLALYQTISAVIDNAEIRITQRRKELQNVRECGSRLTKHRFSY